MRDCEWVAKHEKWHEPGSGYGHGLQLVYVFANSWPLSQV